MNKPTIITVTGTLGAGKGTIADYLVQHYGFKHYSVRSFLTNEIQKRGMELNRDSMTEVANSLREQQGGDCIIRFLVEEARAEGIHAVIESVRAPIEMDYLLQQDDVYPFAADAPIELRYQRAIERNSETDKISFEKFKEDEQREMENSDPAKQNLRYCIDNTSKQFLLINDGTLDEFRRKIEDALEALPIAIQ